MGIYHEQQKGLMMSSVSITFEITSHFNTILVEKIFILFAPNANQNKMIWQIHENSNK